MDAKISVVFVLLRYAKYLCIQIRLGWLELTFNIYMIPIIQFTLYQCLFIIMIISFELWSVWINYHLEKHVLFWNITYFNIYWNVAQTKCTVGTRALTVEILKQSLYKLNKAMYCPHSSRKMQNLIYFAGFIWLNTVYSKFAVH